MTLSLAISLARKHYQLAISQELTSNGITAIFGESGAGKTSLLRALAGLEKNVDGHILYNDDVWLNTHQRIKTLPQHRNVGLVFQDNRLFPHLTVSDNLVFAQKRAAKQRLNLSEIIHLTGIAKLLEQYPCSLSGGEQQRVAIARALLNEPSLLLLDEPFSALDIRHKASLIELLQKINTTYHIPMLYVSHSLDDIQQLADHMLVLEAGKVKQYGLTHDVIHWLNYRQTIKQQTSLILPINSSLSENLQADGLIALSINEQQNILLVQPTFSFHVNNLVRCYIAANDISICLTEPKESSIVNHLNGLIKDIQPMAQQVLIKVHCSGQDFYVLISEYSRKNLQLSLEQSVFIQFKASSVKTLKE